MIPVATTEVVMDMRTELSERLRKERKRRSLSQQDLAEKAEMSVSSVRAYEQARKKPSCHAVTRLAVALDCSHGELDPLTRYEIADPGGRCDGERDPLLTRLEKMAGDGVNNLAQISAILREMNERCRSGDCPLSDAGAKKPPTGVSPGA